MFERLKEPLDWVQRWVAVWQGLVGFGVGKALEAVLTVYTHLQQMWITPIWILASAAVWALLIYWSKQRDIQKPAERSDNEANSLCDRTMALRRELRAFIQANPKPDIARNPEENGNEYIHRKWAEMRPWVDRMMHGFELRFRERMRLLLHEYGELSMYDNVLGSIVERPLNTDDMAETIIEHLGLLALKADEYENTRKVRPEIAT